MLQREDSLLTKYITIFFVVSGYWIVSISTVFINKILLSELNLNAPMFITLAQTIVTVGICLIRKQLSKKWPRRFSFTPVEVFDSRTITDILPLSIMFTLMIASNSLCLKYVSVAFYYIGRSLTTIFNVIFTYVILHQKTSFGCILCCAVIIFGFYLGVDQENLAGSLSLAGTFFGVTASVSLSLFSIFTKKVLPKVDHDIWTLAYCNNVYASIIFMPLMVLNGEVSEVVNYDRLWTLNFWIFLIIGGICGFSVGLLTSLQIKHTSALTHNISGTAKACAQTVLATEWYNESKSLLWWFSNSIILIASAVYAFLKQRDMASAHRESMAQLTSKV